MKKKFKKISLVASFTLALVSGRFNVCAVDPDLPPPASVKINFDRDVRPILETSCLRCHGPQKPKSHFRLDYREGALAGGDNNTNDIVPGNGHDSLLIAYVARRVPDMEMPPAGRGQPLTPQQVSLLRAWIDQGANWTTTNQPPTVNLAIAPFVQVTDVQGNQAKFREIEGTKQGVSGGVQNFSYTEQVSPDERISLQGFARVPEQDFNILLALDKADQGFIHAGFDQWRKYYAPDGGFDPAVNPPEFNPQNNLYVDTGRAWVDVGLARPRWPQITVGYEYDYQNGNEATLDWGSANGVNIYPATQSLDEGTHTVKLNISKNFDDWLLENNARVEFYSQNNQGVEASVLSGTTPGEFITTQDRYRHVQGMDILTLEKQLRGWWLLDGAFYYSRLAGSDFFNQQTAAPSFGINSVLTSQKITLSRESKIFSVANLFSPLNCLALSLASQNEWTREDGFGESIPDLELGGTNIPANSSLDEFKASQSANFRFTKIPFTIVSGDALFSEDDYGIYQGEDTDELQRHTVANNFRYNLKTGFSTSPWQWSALTVQYTRQSSETDYQQLEDLFLGESGPTNGYPGFILERTITSDQFETKLDLHPVPWLKTTLTWQITATDYSSKTDPAYAPLIVSEGGFIADGRYRFQTYGISVTLTPFQRLYLTGAFTYSRSSVVTADNGDPSIAPYRGNIFTVNSMGTFVLNLKTSLQLLYSFSAADYSQDNAAAGVPAGLNYQHQDIFVGLTRKLTKNLSGSLRYGFSQYDEIGNPANNYTANSVMAVLYYRWP